MQAACSTNMFAVFTKEEMAEIYRVGLTMFLLNKAHEQFSRNFAMHEVAARGFWNRQTAADVLRTTQGTSESLLGASTKEESEELARYGLNGFAERKMQEAFSRTFARQAAARDGHFGTIQ